jgi:hypothetical protein
LVAGTANILRRGHQDSLQCLAGGGSVKNIDRSSSVDGVSRFDSGCFVTIGAGGKVKQPLRAEGIKRGAQGRCVENVNFTVKAVLPRVERFALIKI